MPRIFDNITHSLSPALQDTLRISHRADFCVGYFNLRGWKQLDAFVEPWPGGVDGCCRLLVGMQRLPHDELREVFSLSANGDGVDTATVARLKKRMAEEFRDQLTLGAPTDADECGLRRLSAQIKARKVIIKLYLRHTLHAKLYLCYRHDIISPIVPYLGSSNLTFSGLAHQGELNVDVLEQDASHKLESWFSDRWNDKWCLDISDDLAEIIDTSWAREEATPPYHVYLKIAYHLSQEARAGLSEFRIPSDFGKRLFDYQTAAVKIAAHHLNKRGGVLIGDVVGLGKTLMATALARIFQDDHSTETLIICPKNLQKMWEEYVARYRLIAKVLPVTRVEQELPKLRRYRVVLIDESHNLRNREGKRYRAIQEYITENESRCILLSATPYNKTYLDLSAQLRLFVPEDKDLGIRPERLLRTIGEIEFVRRHQGLVRSLAAFEHSPYPDDWRDLMRLYMVRRTRSFIQANYARTNAATGRKYLTFEDGSHSYFPARVPRTVTFAIDERHPDDQYARLYAPEVVDAINALNLPRYGLGNYIAPKPLDPPKPAEAKQLEGLGRSGKRLMGFSRTNLFKRLESGGPAFIQSIERHILRNFVFLHAIEHNLPLPIGTQAAELLDPRVSDEDAEATLADPMENGDEPGRVDRRAANDAGEAMYRARATEVYAEYTGKFKSRFNWLRPTFFIDMLGTHLLSDARALLRVLHTCGAWDPKRDRKLDALYRLLTETRPNEKVLVFTQFADSVEYLHEQLRARGVRQLEGVTGSSADPTGLAWRFSPVSNGKRDLVNPRDELRVLVATDVLSEGQNLQDAALIVNYDLPWAIIRLIQRAGRVDRIGQTHDTIVCYSFLPEEGVNRIIRLRERVRERLREAGEIVGSDESFFEGDTSEQTLRDLYTEKSGILDGDADTEVDLASYAYQIWKNAVDADPSLAKTVSDLPPVSYATRAHDPSTGGPNGVLVYMRTGEGNDALAWIDQDGKPVTQSQLAILQAAACRSDTPALPRHPNHHELVRLGVDHLVQEEKSIGGALGRPSGARFRTYERLKRYADANAGSIFVSQELLKAIDELYRYPLRQSAVDTLNRQLRSGIDDTQLADLVLALRDDDRLCLISDETIEQEPRIICSMGLF